ncbi:MAG: FecR domain-containing protein [Myxococcales bacterium]
MILLVVLGWAVSFSGCGSCHDEPPAVATLIEAKGPGVERDFAAQIHDWQIAQVGAHFGLGDGVRTGNQAAARLTLMDQTQLQLAQNTTLRFMVDQAQAGEQAINVEAGAVSMRVGQKDLMLRTQIGLAKLVAGTEITLRRSGDELDYDVALGEAQFRTASGEYKVLKAGESLEVGIGMAVFSKAEPPTDPVVEPIDPGAIVATVKGKGARSRQAGGTWTPLAAGQHELAPGTELRLGRGDRADVSRGDQRANLRGSGEFVVGSGAALVEARTGDLTLVADQQDLQVLVPGGSIVVRGGKGGSEAVVSIGEDDANIALKKGAASVDILGMQRELEAGEQHKWENPNAEGAEKPIVAEATYFNLGTRAGESFVLHAPEVPAAVHFDFGGRCPGEGVIELTGPRTRTRGKGAANVVIPAIATPYTLRCFDESGGLGKVVARGTVQVLNDAGTRRLPAKAPTSFVEADGRTYTIYYQNQLPEISVRWPNAPAGSAFDLIVDGQPTRVARAEHLFTSGSLKDGSHQLSFQAGDRRSRTTTVEVRFDNAAPKASLTSPIDRGFKPGDTVTIEGVALETWKVSVEGGRVSVDADDRFVGQVASAADRPDIAVRLAHPRLGVHYYLRRAAGSP